MRAATGRQIEAGDLDQAQLAGHGGFLAQRQGRGFLRRHMTNHDDPIFPNDLVGQIDCLLNAFLSGLVERDIDFANLIQHAEPARFGAKQ